MRKWLVLLLTNLCIWYNSGTLSAQITDSSKKEQYLEIGTGLFTIGDFLWNDNHNPLIKPSYYSFIYQNDYYNSKALPIQFTYKKQRKKRNRLWYANVGLELARKKYSYYQYDYTTFRFIYTNVGGVEYQYLKYKNFCLSLKLGLGFSFYYEEEFNNAPGFGKGIYYDEYPPKTIFMYPAIEIQPINMRLGNKNAVFINLLSLGTTGFVQFGYSRKW